MKEVKWNSRVSPGRILGKIGCVNLRCRMVKTNTGKKQWYGYIWFSGYDSYSPMGPMRHSLAEAKEDCIRLARETMLNYREGLREELKNFDLAMEQE